MIRGLLILIVTVAVLIAVMVGVVGAGLHRIAAEQKQADESWQKPEPTTAPATNPTDTAVLAAEVVPAAPKIDSINLDPKDATCHGQVQFIDRQKEAVRVPPEFANDPLRAEKFRRWTNKMRSTQNSTYLTGFRTSDDFVEWQIQVPKAGNYEIDVTYACPQWEKGGHFSLTVGDKELAVVPESTRSETNFRMGGMGKLELSAGGATLRLRPAPVSMQSRCFINLRSIQLIPAS